MFVDNFAGVKQERPLENVFIEHSHQVVSSIYSDL